MDSDEVSRRHAVIAVSAGGATLADLGSKNGTFLWGERVERATRLEEGDEITVGPAVLVVRSTAGLATTRTARRREPPPAS